MDRLSGLLIQMPAMTTTTSLVTFVLQVLPIGLIGLLFAVIFSASMSSTSSEINALAGTFAVDIYKRLLKRDAEDKHYVLASRLFTLLFGALAITFALVASLFDNLIEAVNIIGSLFYGTILGIFLTAFLLKPGLKDMQFYSGPHHPVYHILPGLQRSLQLAIAFCRNRIPVV